MSVTRVYIESTSITKQEVYPAFAGGLQEFELSKADEQVYFLTDWPELTFDGEDYTTLKTAGGCEEITVSFEELCGGDWAEKHVGTFTNYDEKINENTCTAGVKPKTKDVFTCILDNWELEKIIFSITPKITTQAVQGTYQSPTALCCQACYPAGIIPSLPICTAPTDYCWTGTNFDQGINPIACGNSTDHRFRTCFHRVLGVGTPTNPPTYGGTGTWIHISGNDWWRCPTTEELSMGLFEQGRLFNSVLVYLVNQMFCGLTVRSYFFDINATHAAPPTNGAYDYAVAYLQKMTVHQKSDVKRPFDSNPAESKVWKMTLKKLLDDLRTMFQVYWTIDGTDLIIEHITYFAAASGLDVTDQDLVLEYGKQEGGAPKNEYFFWQDRANFPFAFGGAPITYDCGGAGKEYQVNLFDTDTRYIRKTDNAEDILDSNFVLVSNLIDTFKYYVINNNEPLGWQSLHENLHRDYRYFIEGTMNNTPTTFNSTRKTRNLKEFELSLCCDVEFNPTNDIETSLGPVSPQKVTINYSAADNTRIYTINANV